MSSLAGHSGPQRSGWLSERFSMSASLENLLVYVCMCVQALILDVFIC